MVKRTRSKRIDRSQASRYAEAGRVFLESARTLSDIADDTSPYGNAIALLSIHAAISYTDALTIAFAEQKSADQHVKAVDNLRAALGSRVDDAQAKILRQILQPKDTVSYQGTFYGLKDGRALLKKAEGFCRWAKDTYEARPSI